MKNSTTPNFKTHNDSYITFHPTKRGEIVADYKKLVALFGEPTEEGEGEGGWEVDAEWLIEFEDGTEARVYNYKNGKNWNGSFGTPISMIKNWCVDSEEDDNSGKALQYIKELIK